MGLDRFARKSVVVTGAGSGIGFETARQFVDQGALVVAADIDVRAVPTGCVAIPVDVSEPSGISRLLSAAEDVHGPIDILCNNAGVGSTSSVVDCKVEEWERTFAVNVRSIFLAIKFVLPSMLARRGGVIVNMGSVAGLFGIRNRAAYSASKGAVIALTKQVATQYGAAGIRCNCVCPGTIDTPWVSRLADNSDDPVAARAALVDRQPLGRLGQASEVAAAVLYLASAEAAFCSGTILVVDGGITAGSNG